MITETYTADSKTETQSDVTSVELVKDNRWQRRVMGIVVSHVDFPDAITISGPEAEAIKLGDQFRITLEKIA